ncbi:MAG: GrdX family protein [Bacillota bacterium]|nr:GrdX family protein [Bacillota bacterium]
MEKFSVITNNSIVKDKFINMDMIFMECELVDILKYVRDKVHLGYILLSHPLAGSVKPNETPYKSVLISKNKYKEIDLVSLRIIEDSIEMSEKLIRDRKMRKWPERIIKDFAIIDLDLISSAIESAY